jgi:lysophospholipase L1-like esterase
MPSVFILGDSISIQYGEFLPPLLLNRVTYARKDGNEAAYANLDIPQGANGGDSSMCLAYLQARCAEPDFAPDLLLLNCGLHDIKCSRDTQALQIDAEAYRANLEAMVALLAQRDIALAWSRTTQVIDEQHNSRSKDFTRSDADQQRYNAIADEVMNRAEARIIDLDGFTRTCGGVEAFCDHVHFVPPVRRLQAAYVAGHILGWLS